MTPASIRFRLFQAQSTELRRIVAELQSNRPANLAELVAVCREAQAELIAAAMVFTVDGSS